MRSERHGLRKLSKNERGGEMEYIPKIWLKLIVISMIVTWFGLIVVLLVLLAEATWTLIL
jgi:hypothetical protein